jgi:hypothetical protein
MSAPILNRRDVVIGLGTLAARSLRGEAQVMQHRTLGRTGETVSCIGLGGAHIGKPKLSSQEAVRLIRQAVDKGITFLDNSWDL